MSVIITRRWRYHYLVDVLTDGAERTGFGTLFLSVYRSEFVPNKSKCQSNNDDGNKPLVNFSNVELSSSSSSSQTTIKATPDQLLLGEAIARYALAGVGDCTNHLAADQRYKLKSVKAAFCTGTGDDNDDLFGIVSALREAGAPSVALVTPNNVQDLV